MKLVRDRIPELFPQHSYRRAEGQEEMITLLLAKVVEEAKEVSEAPDQKSRAEEIGDLLDVLDALAGMSGISVSELVQIRIEKRRERGDFMLGWVLK